MKNYENCETCFASQYAEELKSVELLQECEHSVNQNQTPLVIETTPMTCEGSACQSLVEVVETSGGVRDSNISIIDECKTAEVVAPCDEFSEDGGVEECHTLVKSEEVITVADDYFVDIPLEIDTTPDINIVEDGGTSGSGENIEVNEINENAFASISSQFCIVNNPPFEDLKPYNLYKLRASIVSVENENGKKGAGLIIADNMVLTSADLIQKDNNRYSLTTVNGKEMKASAFRVNPTKNVAVLLLDTPTTYQPLPMSLSLPEVEKDILLTLGLLNFEDEGENYIDNEGRVVGYRWSEERGAEIIVDTFVQTVTLGGALIDQKGNIIGIAHETKKSENSPDLFIPIETALNSLGLEICGQKPTTSKPKSVKIFTPIADAIDSSPVDKSPKPISSEKRK